MVGGGGGRWWGGRRWGVRGLWCVWSASGGGPGGTRGRRWGGELWVVVEGGKGDGEGSGMVVLGGQLVRRDGGVGAGCGVGWWGWVQRGWVVGGWVGVSITPNICSLFFAPSCQHTEEPAASTTTLKRLFTLSSGGTV